MRITVQIVLLFAALRVSGNAQDLRSMPRSRERPELLVRDVVIPQFEGQRQGPEADSAEHQSQQIQERQFLEKANAFVRMWTAFAKEYNDKKTFNAKLATKIAKAFHELENSNSWPRAK